MKLVSVYRINGAERILYDLLFERTPEQSISHTVMPSLQDHRTFVQSRPYLVWMLIVNDGEFVGSVYVTKQNEIGIFVFKKHKGKGFGAWAVETVSQMFPKPVYANISPLNTESQRFFTKLGGRPIQYTYAL